MKKLLAICLLLVLAVSFVSAQETTWTNPYDSTTWLLPRSMVSTITNGYLYDAIDVLVASPAELSDFEGVYVYTAYGNYQSYNYLAYGDDPMTGTPVVGSVNPFTTVDLSGYFANDDTDTSNTAFALGYIMPIMGFQSGIVVSYEEFINELLDGYSGSNTEYTSTTTFVNDTNADGSIGYTASSDFTYADYSTDNSFTLGSGVDLGFMGASLYFSLNDWTRYLGGTYDYTLTPGADTADFDPAAAEQTTSKSIIYGYKEDGSTGAYAVLDNEWTLALNGELPLIIADFSMPVTASIQVNAGSDGGTSYSIPQTVSITDSYVDTDGAGGTADDTSTLSYTVGVAGLDSTSTTIGATTVSTEHIAANTPVVSSADWTDVENVRDNGNYAQNTAGIEDSYFTGLVKGRIDPKFEISDILSAKTRFQTELGFYSDIDTISGTKTISYSRADDGTSNSTYTYSSTTTNPAEDSAFLLNFELGGVLEAKTKDESLVVSTGAFYNPRMRFSSTANLNEVTTTTATAVDNSTTPVGSVTAASGIADVGFGVGDLQGTVQEVTTVTYSGKSTTNDIEHNIIIPVSASVNLFDKKLSIIGGYTLLNTISNTITTTPDSTSDTVTTVTASDGTDASPADDSVQETTTGTVVNNWSSTDWEGFMNFMVRWLPTDFVTVDFFGQSIMQALDMDIFGGGGGGGTNDGLNLKYLIENLYMSVTFHFTD